MDDRKLPTPSPETRHYWEGLAQGEIRLQHCGPCDQAYFPPRPFCPRCGGTDIAIVKASGRATLYSYVINHLPAPGFTPPYAVAVAELAEGPRLMTNIVDCPQTTEALRIDMPLSPVFQPVADGTTLLVFRPVGAA